MDSPRIQLNGLLESYSKVLAKEQNREYYDEMMLNLRATLTEERIGRCEGLLYEGIKLFELNQYEAAYEKFEECKSVYVNGDAWHHQGVINFELGNFKRAFEEFSASILLFKDYASAYRFRALSIIYLLEQNDKLHENLDIERFAIENLEIAIDLGDQEAERAFLHYYG